MTVVMEEDGFNTSLSSLSTLTSQTNYQTLTNNGNNSNRTTIFQNQNQSNSPPSSMNMSNQEMIGPYAIFLFRSNSGLELFEERKISLDKPCKIGRSVAKIKPEPNNAIFDCKVLSRNHALLWHENSKFFIQDTKSSNGTFLNGNRLGKSNEDSAPFDLTSGDIIQFGVDVTENTKKVTHGCITVEIKLFHKPGVEASIFKPNQATQSNKIDVQTQELYQLALFLQEAMMREEVLNQKLGSLQAFVDQAKETSENGWLTLIDEDRLLSRIDFLEKQANLFNKNHTDESLKNSIYNLTNEKFSVENTAKLAIQKMIEEKNETMQKFDQLKTIFKIRDEECTQVQKVLDESKLSVVDLAGKYQDLLNEITDLQTKLNENYEKNQDINGELDIEKQRYETLVEESSHVEKTLNTKIESLIAEKDFTSKRLEGILNKIEKNNIVLNNEINTEKTNQSLNENKIMENGDETKDELIIKSEKIINGLPELNGVHNHIDDDLNSYENNKIEKSEIKVENESNIEYYQQELELKTIMNDNLLKEIERLKSILNNEPNHDISLNSENNTSLENLPNKINDLTNLKNEFNFIKKKILQIEDDTKNILSDNKSGKENLMDSVNSFEKSLKKINKITNLEPSKESTDELNLTDAQKESEINQNKYIKLQEEYNELELNYNSTQEELTCTVDTVTRLNTEFNDISLQVKIVSYFSTFPLLVLIIAIMVSFYPVLETITATGV